MEIDKYMSNALHTSVYPGIGNNLVYPAIGLAGEAGEVCNNIKKLMRDYNYKQGMNFAAFYDSLPGKGQKLVRDTYEELGDVMWYIASMCHEFGITMQQVAKDNNDKLARRYARRKISLKDINFED